MKAALAVAESSTCNGPSTPVEMEAFNTGGTKPGALVRQVSTDRIDTLSAFQVLDGPLVHLEQSTLFDKSPLDWTGFRFSDHLDGIVPEGSRDNWVSGRNGLPAEKSVSAVPSYAAHGNLTSFLRTAAESVDFEQFAEGDRNTRFRASFFAGEERKSSFLGRLSTLGNCHSSSTGT